MSEARVLALVMQHPHPSALARSARDRSLFQALRRLEARGCVTRRRGLYRLTRLGSDELSAAWGGLLTTAAMSRKARGVVTDGGARDYEEIVDLGFPTFCRGLTPYDSLGRMDVVEIHGLVRCGGIAVRPGDLIFADMVGIVVVPQELADEVIDKAWEKVNGESKVREALRNGASVAETFAKYGIL